VPGGLLGRLPAPFAPESECSVPIAVYPHLLGNSRDRMVSALKEKKDVKRMNINVEASLHDAFKAATAARGENMTDILMKFIEDYVAKSGVAPKKKGRR
jgi:ParG